MVTDSLFWLVKQYCGASLSETFKYYTTATFIASLLALAATFLLSFII
ncbi:GntT/GntP/DsdX family permease [Klebsiella aerogenes]